MVEDVVFTEQTPVLVVEILSQSTRAEDTLRKSVEYQAAGISQYWTIDREQRTVLILANNGAGWDVLLELDDERPSGEVVVGDDGTVRLDLDHLLAP